MKSFVTTSNIALVFSFIGISLSLYNFIVDRLRHRLHIGFLYKGHTLSDFNDDITLLISIDNKVDTSVSITRLQLQINDRIIDSYWLPQFTYEAKQESRNQVTDTINVHSLVIPQHLQGYGAIGGFFCFPSKVKFKNDDLLHSKIKLIVSTNKGIKEFHFVMDTPNPDI